MIIYAKSSLSKEQLDVKMNIGCDGIEIQLLSELVDGEIGRYSKATDIFKLSDFNKYPIKVVHCPLLWRYGLADVNIESFACNDFDLLDQVCYIANYFGELQSDKIIVVIHSEVNMDNLVAVDLLRKVVSTISYMLMKYKNIEIAIENVTPLRKVYQGEICFCNNFHFDNIALVKYIREELKTERVGTCLDTCHAMITDRYMTEIYKILEDIEYKDYSLDSYFEKNKDYIKLIHLSDFRGNGYKKGKHGVRFTENTKDRLKDIIGMYNKYNYKCPITLEVNETDYSLCDGYKETKDVLEELFERHRLAIPLALADG